MISWQAPPSRIVLSITLVVLILQLETVLAGDKLPLQGVPWLGLPR